VNALSQADCRRGGVINGSMEHFPPEGNRLCRLQTLLPPYTGSANPMEILLWRSDEPHGG
jgi:hypothetical protein